MIRKTLWVAAVVIVLITAAVGCTAEVGSVPKETENLVVITTPSPSPPTPIPTPTPIKTTEPEPDPEPVAVISVEEGDTLERDILSEITKAFDISEDDAKQALS